MSASPTISSQTLQALSMGSSMDERVAVFLCVCWKGIKMQMAMMGNFPHPPKVGEQGNSVKE